MHSRCTYGPVAARRLVPASHTQHVLLQEERQKALQGSEDEGASGDEAEAGSDDGLSLDSQAEEAAASGDDAGAALPSVECCVRSAAGCTNIVLKVLLQGALHCR